MRAVPDELGEHGLPLIDGLDLAPVVVLVGLVGLHWPAYSTQALQRICFVCPPPPSPIILQKEK
jgi:hypothetical protein